MKPPFKSKASEVHPDRVSPANPYLKNIAAEALKNFSEAKAVLLDAGKRQNYDAELAYSRGSSAKPPGGTGAATVAPDAAASAATAPAPHRAAAAPFFVAGEYNSWTHGFERRLRDTALGRCDRSVPRRACSSSFFNSGTNNSRSEPTEESVLSDEKRIARHRDRPP